jgi:hypothetical protein
MRRLFWLAAGLGAGVSGTLLFSRWLQRQAERFAPPNVARQAGQALTSAGSELSGTLGTFVEAFRQGMAEREAEIEAELRSPNSRG